MHTVVADTTGGINFAASGIDEIIQNIRTIVTTVKGTVPLDRDFGIDTSSLDGPLMEITQARMTDRIYDAISRYEPRVEVMQVEYQTDQEGGKLIPIVRFRLQEGVSP